MAQIEYTFILFTGLIGFLLIYLMLTKYGASKLINGFLIFNIGISSFRFVIYGTYNLHFQHLIEDFNSPFKFILLLLFPSSYLYIKAITGDRPIDFVEIFKHLSIPLLVFIFNVICLLNHYELSYLALYVNLSVALLMAVYYLYKTFFVCYNKLWKKKFSINIEHYQIIKKWTIFYCIIVLLMTFRVTISFIFEHSLSYSISGKHVSLALGAALWLLVFIRIFKTPEILFGIPKLSIKTPHFEEVNSNISDVWKISSESINAKKDLKLKEKLDSNVLQLIQEIEYTVKEKQIFYRSKVSLNELAIEVGVPESHLNYLFRYHCTLSFLEYKNKMRIAYSISLIENGYLSKSTLDSLAKDVGFASYSPFYNAFKKINGIGPNEFMCKFNYNQV
jgi:AraC-like DNA-binding protein